MVILRGREPMIYDPSTATKGGKGGEVADTETGSVWNTCEEYATAEALRAMGQSQRTVRPTAMASAS